MAHEVEQMFSVKMTPWHGLGHIVQHAPTAEEAIRLAGLDWTVKELPIFRVDNASQGLREIASHKAVVRTDTDSVLGVVGQGYTPLQNRDAFAFFDPFIADKQAQFETAGSLREGKNIWVLAKLNRDPIEVVKNDLVEKFLLLSNGHDGTMAVRVGFTPVRVVCANTLAMSHGSKKSSLIRVIHGAAVNLRLEQVRSIMNAANAQFEATAEQYRALARKEISQEDLKNYVKIVFKPGQEFETERQQRNFDKLSDNIIRLFETGRGAEIKGVRGTFWGAYNAVTEYLTHEKLEGVDRRAMDVWFGHGKKVNDLALSSALEMAA